MKKTLFIAGFILLFSFTVYAGGAFQMSQTSGEQTSGKVVYTGPCYLTAVVVLTDGSNDAALSIVDSTGSYSGVTAFKIDVNGPDNYGGRLWNFPLMFNSGVSVNLSGTGASYIVEYIKEN